jgi:hypothetical protein
LDKRNHNVGISEAVKIDGNDAKFHERPPNQDTQRRERERMEDVIIDVIVNGRVLLPQEIPMAVTEAVRAILAKEEPPQAIEHEGICYCWSIRPCVYP